MAACVTCSSAAALVKLRWRAAASKARNAFKGGSRGVMTYRIKNNYGNRENYSFVKAAGNYDILTMLPGSSEVLSISLRDAYARWKVADERLAQRTFRVSVLRRPGPPGARRGHGAGRLPGRDGLRADCAAG